MARKTLSAAHKAAISRGLKGNKNALKHGNSRRAGRPAPEHRFKRDTAAAVLHGAGMRTLFSNPSVGIPLIAAGALVTPTVAERARKQRKVEARAAKPAHRTRRRRK